MREAKAERLESGGVLELVESDAREPRRRRGPRRAEGLARAARQGPRTRRGGARPGAAARHPDHGRPRLREVPRRQGGRPHLELPAGAARPARIYAKYVGESEQRIAEALEAVEAMAPVVLWIDEIEKGFAAGDDGDGGVEQARARHVPAVDAGAPARRLHRRDRATTSRSLPPELLRKGRFDEIFFVDLPTAEERQEILRLHLASRRRDPEAFDLDRLAAASEGFTGAEIEAAIVGGDVPGLRRRRPARPPRTIKAELGLDRPPVDEPGRGRRRASRVGAERACGPRRGRRRPGDDGQAAGQEADPLVDRGEGLPRDGLGLLGADFEQTRRSSPGPPRAPRTAPGPARANATSASASPPFRSA